MCEDLDDAGLAAGHRSQRMQRAATLQPSHEPLIWQHNSQADMDPHAMGSTDSPADDELQDCLHRIDDLEKENSTLRRQRDEYANQLIVAQDRVAALGQRLVVLVYYADTHLTGIVVSALWSLRGGATRRIRRSPGIGSLAGPHQLSLLR